MKTRVMSGTAIGGSHLNTRTNGQDALSVRQSASSLIIAVADGCSSQPHSGVGASIFAPICTAYFQQALRRGLDLKDPRVRRNIRKRLTSHMQVLADQMAGDSPAAPIINQHFQFTLVVMVMTEESTYFLRIGDGMYGYNGQVHVLKPTTGNKPIYLAYDLTGSPMTDAVPALLDFEIVATVPTSEITEFWIGTDGMAEVLEAAAAGRKVTGSEIENASEMLHNPEYYDDPAALTLRLGNIVEDGYGSDDVTFIGGCVEQEPVIDDTPTDSETDNNDTGKAKADDESAPAGSDSDSETDITDTNGES